MKNVKTFKEFINESLNESKLPVYATKFAKQLKKQWKKHEELEGVYSIHMPGYQIEFDTTGDWGGPGISIGDEDGTELYFGENPSDAAKVLKK